MYRITTICIGPKYELIKPYWKKQISSVCSPAEIEVFDSIPPFIKTDGYAWWDVLRLKNNIDILLRTREPVVHIDIDVVVRKDIRPLIDLEYDIIFSREIGGSSAFPKECSSRLGFGICSGLYILKPSAIQFLLGLLYTMRERVYNNYSDQVSLMNYIVETPHVIGAEEFIHNGKTYTNHIIIIDGIRICVLDFDVIIRDPVFTIDQFADHINIENVGGVANFLKYFQYPLESLPLTCRCGKTHLGDTSVCPHIALRSQDIR